jgi:hypothetical protein
MKSVRTNLLSMCLILLHGTMLANKHTMLAGWLAGWLAGFWDKGTFSFLHGNATLERVSWSFDPLATKVLFR